MPEEQGPAERTPMSLNKTPRRLPGDIAGVARRGGDQPDLDNARTVYPVMFTEPGTDTYVNPDDRNPAFSDFRPVPYPADAEVNLGEIVDPEPDVPEGTPKDSSAQESASSSISTPEIEPPAPEQTAPEIGWTPPDFSGDAGKDSGTLKESESSTQTS